jgi:hypothetical protein
VSVRFPNGSETRRTRAGRFTVETDVYGCHGTSGSGMMQLGARGYELLGPVATGTADHRTRLCMNPANHVPGGPGISYTATRFVMAIAALGDAR